jgi:uncharacterized protein (TIGR00255 family)
LIQSMTGFAERKFDSKTLSAKISVKSLNHRFLDWSYRGAQIGEVENKLRAISQRKLHRGRVEVFFELNYLDPSFWELRINENLLQKILSSLEKLSSRMGKSVNLSAENIFSLPNVVEFKRKNFSREEVAFLESSFERTLAEVVRMRKREGREIGKEIRKHLQNIKQALSQIEKLAKRQPIFIRERLKRRLKELKHEAPLSDERIAEEASYLAQRYDLTEEIERLKSHLAYVLDLLSPEREEPVGKKLDFVVQEIYREANTINSKSQDIEIVRGSLAIKEEVESIRQQLQNIE